MNRTTIWHFLGWTNKTEIETVTPLLQTAKATGLHTGHILKKKPYRSSLATVCEELFE